MGFPDRLKELRESKGISQETLADALGIPRSSLSHYERIEQGDNVRLPRRERLEKIADYFGVSVDYLLGRTDDPSPYGNQYSDDTYDYRKDPTVTGELREFLDELVKLPPKEQDEIIEMARTFVAGLKTRNRPS